MAKPLENALKIFAVTFLVITGAAFVLGGTAAFAGGITAVSILGASVNIVAFAALSAVGTLVGGLLSKGIEASRDNFGTKVASRTPTAPRQIVYGKCRVGGTITHIETLGSENEKLTMVVALAGHEIESLEEILINDTKLETTTSGGFKYATNQRFINSDNDNAFSGGYLLRYRFLDGSQTTGDSTIANNSSLTTNDKYIGVPIVFIQMIYDSEAFGGGIPPMAFVIKGKKVYDPREAGHTFGTESTYEWSDNPALHILDFITNTTYGLKATADEFLETDTVGSFLQAANHCDVGNTITTATVNGAVTSSTSVVIDGASTNTLIDVGHSVTGTGISGTVKVVKRVSNTLTLSSAVSIADGVTLTFSEAAYTSNGFTNFSADGGGVIEGLLSSCAGKLSYINGKFVMFAGVNRSATLSINDDNLLAPIQISTKQQSGETFNSVKSIYVDANNNYVATDSPTYEDSTFLSEDTPSGESSANYKKVLELQLPFTDTNTMAQRLQKSALIHQRKQTTLNVLCNISFMQLQPNDWVYLTNERLSYTNKTFEVLSTNLEVIDADSVPVLATRLALKEIDNTVYTFSSSNYNNPIDEGTSVSTGDFSVSAPTGLSVSATLINTGYDLNVQWTNIADDNIQGTEILYGTSSGTYTGSVITGKGVAKEIINNVKPNTTYYIVARHFSNNNVFSAKTSEVTINTNSDSGITTPSAPTSLSATTGKPLSIGLSWTNPSNSDLRDIQIYRSTSSGFTPDDNTNLVRTIAGVPSVSQKVSFGIDDGLVAGTTYYFKVKAVSFFDKVSTASSQASGSFTKVEATDIEGIFSGYFHVEGSTTTALSDSAFNIAHGRLPIEDDILIMVNTSASPKVSKAYKYSGTAGSGGSFVEITNFTTGDLIAGETIAGNKLIANTITATQIDADTITATEIASNTITASQIASNTITATQISSNTITATEMNVSNLSSISADIGTITSGSLNIGSGAFTVSTAGVMTATGATVSGSITSTSGTIGGFTLGTTSLTAGSNTTRVSLSTADGIHLGNNTFSSAPFRVTRAGELTATNANVTGDLETGNLIVTGNAGIHGEVRATSLTAGTVTVASINQEVWNEIDARTAPTQNGFYDNYDSTSTGTYYNGVATNFELLGSSGNGYLSNGQSISIRTSMVHGYGQQGSQTYTGDALKATFQFQYKQLPSGNWTNFGSAYVGVTSVYTIPNGFFYELDADPDASVSLSNGVYYQFRLRVTPTVTNNVWADSDANDVFAIAFAIQQSSTGTGAGTGTVTSVGSGDGLSGGPITGSGTLTVDSTVVRTSGVQTVSGNKTFANNIVIQGNLDVQGTTTTVDSNDLNVKDKNITINYSTGDSSATANGAGITIQDAVNSSTDATILWNTSTDNFDFSHGINITGSIASSGNYTITDAYIIHNNTTFGTFDWQAYQENSGKYVLTVLGTGGAELQLSSDGSDYTNAILNVGGQRVLTQTAGINLNGDLGFNDGYKAKFGTNHDLQIYHATNNSYIQANGTGSLYIENLTQDTGDIIMRINDGGSNKTMIFIDSNIGVTKFQNQTRHADTVKANFGASNDLQIWHDSSGDNNIRSTGGDIYITQSVDDGDILIESDNGSGGSSTYAMADGSEGSFKLFHYGSKKLETTSTGVTVTGYLATNTSGGVFLPDNSKILIGSSNDLEIYHDTTDTFIKNNEGILNIASDTINLERANGSELYLSAFANGSVYLYHNGNARLSTTSGGIEVTGTVTSSANIIAGSTSGASVQLNPSGSIELCRTAGNADPFIDFKDSASDDYDARIRMDNNNLYFSVGGAGNIATPLTLSTTGIDVTGTTVTDGLTSSGVIKPETNGAIDLGVTGTNKFRDLFLQGKIDLQSGSGSNNALFFFNNSVKNGWIGIPAWDNTSFRIYAPSPTTGNTNETAAMYKDGAWSFWTDYNNTSGSGSTSPALFVSTGGSLNVLRGDIQVGGQTVISSARNLTNIGNVELGSANYLYLNNGGYDGAGTHAGIQWFSTGSAQRKAADIITARADSFARSDLLFRTQSGTTNADPTEVMRITHDNYVGINTDQPSNALEVNGNIAVNTSSGNNGIKIITGNTAEGFLIFGDAQDNSMGIIAYDNSTNNLIFDCNNAEAARFDSSLNFLVGQQSQSPNTVGISLNNNGNISAKRDGGIVALFNRATSDGEIISIRKDDGTVGRISSTSTGIVLGTPLGSGSGIHLVSNAILPSTSTGGTADGSKDLGSTSSRFKDLHLSGNANIGNNLDVSNDLTVQGVSTFDDSIQGQQGTSATFSEFHVGSNVAIGIEVSNLTTTSTTQTSRTLGSASTYRTFKLMVQATSGTSYHATEILLTHDGTTVYMTEYGTIFTGSSLATFDADISSGNVRLLVDPSQSASTVFKFSLSAIKV